MTKKIGEVAVILDVSVDTLRYYEKISLLGQVPRNNSGVRHYDDALIARIRFIRHAQRMGFSLESIGEMLTFRESPTQAKPQVRAMVQEKIVELNQRIHDLSQLKNELVVLTESCKTNTESHCPILQEFEK